MTKRARYATVSGVTISGGPHLDRVHDALDVLRDAIARHAEATQTGVDTATRPAPDPVKQAPAPPPSSYGR